MTAHALARVVFQTSRLGDFASQKQLEKQTGHAVFDWLRVTVKELIDNALDACEEAGIEPVIDVAVADDLSITVIDNGPGIAPDTIAKLIDYSSRVSSREAYISPTRGAQGNALSTLLAMPFALDDSKPGTTVIKSQGVEHTITFSADPIRQTPKIEHTREPSNVKTGTRFTTRWPYSACSFLADARSKFLHLATAFTWINPHLTLSIAWELGERIAWTIAATDPAWRKSLPSDPMSPHWFNVERLGRLMAAHIAHGQDNPDHPVRTLARFVAQFKGLSGSAKVSAICEAVGATRSLNSSATAGSPISRGYSRKCRTKAERSSPAISE
jgi:DNA topoisomerase VI subunit B